MRQRCAHVLSLAGMSRRVFGCYSVGRHGSGQLMIGIGQAREAWDKPAGRKGLATIPVPLRRPAVWLLFAATVIACAVGASGSLPAQQDSTAQHAQPDITVQRSATAFLAAYVQPDGRVYRPDQGGDTVS